MTAPGFEPRDSNYESRIRDSFSRQRMMRTMSAELIGVLPGQVEIAMPFLEELTQQNDYLHAGAVTAIADSACGYAALSLMDPEHDVLSVEFKINLLAPGRGERFVAVGQVVRPGRTLTVCNATVHALQGAERKLIAAMQATMISAGPRQ